MNIPLAKARIHEQISQLGPWFHNLRLPDGTQTCPDHRLGDFPSYKWQQLAPYLPTDLRDATVLDIGCNAGFYSLELAKRGARVTAIDSDEHYLAQARWAASQWQLESRISFEQEQVYGLARREQRWDIVLFMGVFYHLRYPLLGLDVVSRCVKQQLIFQSLSVPGAAAEVPEDIALLDREPLTRPSWPKLSFIEKRLAGDQTNWWAPNEACVEAVLRSSGFRIEARPLEEFYICVPDPGHPSDMWTWNEAEFRAANGLR